MDDYFLGLDCSSKGIHGVIIDQQSNLVYMDKWISKLPDFEARFPAFLFNFYENLSIIKERFPNLQVAIEAPIFILPKNIRKLENVFFTGITSL